MPLTCTFLLAGNPSTLYLNAQWRRSAIARCMCSSAGRRLLPWEPRLTVVLVRLLFALPGCTLFIPRSLGNACMQWQR